MLECIVLVLFALALLLCLLLDVSLLLALALGFFLFFGYALLRGHRLYAVLKMAFSGIKTVAPILLVFLLIGMITAFWRACGTIAYIVYHATAVFSPSTVLLATFLLCAALSVLTGTAFGTSATMGMICGTIAAGMGIHPALIGGAVMSGSYFGDRLSPMSTSALLVATVTGTDIFANIRRMIPPTVVPTVLSCLVYFLLGQASGDVNSAAEVCALFEAHFTLTPWLLLPAAVIVVLSLFKVRVKITLLVSLIFAVVLAVLVQGMPLPTLLRTALLGFTPTAEALAGLMSGGGIRSMLNVCCIILLSATYAGIFKNTGLVNSIKHRLTAVSKAITPFGGTLLTSAITAMISCNQTLAIMLSNELCDEIVEDGATRALYLENTAVIIAPLIPWSIACGVTLAAVNAPPLSVVAACYLYLLPLWQYAVVLWQRKKHPVTK